MPTHPNSACSVEIKGQMTHYNSLVSKQKMGLGMMLIQWNLVIVITLGTARNGCYKEVAC